MSRRIYFTFPKPEQVRQVVGELEKAGINRSAMHCLAKEGVDLSGLPMATEAQRTDRIWYWDQTLWQGALITFAVFITLLLFSLLVDVIALTFSLIGLSAALFLTGAYFAIRIPHTHLDQMKVPLQHGEVVLLIDVPLKQVRTITRLVESHHPEAGLGGVGWTLNHAGI